MHPKTLIAAIAIALPALAVAPRLRAQDVTVTPLEWAELDDAPDQLPVENHPLRVTFPEDLRNSPDLAYVMVQAFTDEKGRWLSFYTLGTLPAYEKAVSEGSANWKLNPGLRLGHPVNTYTRCAVIFNPASAAEGRPDATPRVLAVRPVIDVSRKTKAGQPSAPPEVVWATVALDATGEPTGLKDAPSTLASLCEKSLRRWRFAPARHAGQPVAGELRVPFVVVSEELTISGRVTPPRAIAQPAPVYPMAMRYSGLRGDVLVDFVVDREGRVTHAFVARSLNPAFDEPAFEAVRRWKFEPGRKGDVPVNTHVQVPIGFRLDGEWEGGSTGLSAAPKANQADLPEGYRYDVAPKPRGRVAPVYPYDLLRDKVKGAATVVFIINERGRIVYANVNKATQPEFGAATIAMVEQWEFEPALKDGRPTRSGFAFEQEFSRYDRDLVPDEVDDVLSLEQKHPERIVPAGKLDEPLKPVSTRPPVFPVSAPANLARGEAVVEILIDEEGRARLPRVFSASDPAFGWAAVQAVSVWRFDPPTRKGRPVVTRVRIPFDFTSTPAQPAEVKK